MRFRTLMEWVGRILSLACLILLISLVVRYHEELPAIEWSVGTVGVSGLVILFGIVGVALNAQAWKVLMAKLQPISFLTAFSITGRSQIAKYLPGNVFHYVGKMILAQKAGLRTRIVVMSMLLEIVLLVFTATAIGAVGYALSDREYRLYTYLFLAVLVAIPLLWRVLKSRVPVLSEGIDRVGVGNLLRTVAWQTASLVLFGTTAYLLSRGLWPGVYALGWWEMVWAGSLAWVVGFVTPGAPGGIGVREGLLVALFSSQMGYASAATLFLALRLVQMISDGLAFMLAVWIQDKR